jgi:hypothetical protein
MHSAIATLERPADQPRSEPEATAPLPAYAVAPQRSPVLGRLPLLLMVLALAVLASQVSLSFSVTSGTPLFIAGGNRSEQRIDVGKHGVVGTHLGRPAPPGDVCNA